MSGKLPRPLVVKAPRELAYAEPPQLGSAVDKPVDDRLLPVALLLDVHAGTLPVFPLRVDAVGAVGRHAAHERRRVRAQDSVKRPVEVDPGIEHAGRRRRE